MNDDARPAWAARLQAERERRGWNKHEMARRLRRAAGVEYLPVKTLAHQVRRWERGQHFPRDWTSAYATAYGITEEELFSDADAPAPEDITQRRNALKLGLVAAISPDTLQRVLREATAEALEFTRLTGVSAVGAGTLGHLEAVITNLNRSYSRRPPAEQFVIARAYRTRVAQLIEGRHTLKEVRELYAYAAWLSELLAWLSHDLGDPMAAEAYAVDCFEHADQTGHDELCAWASDAMASIALYTDRPRRAADAAIKGLVRAPAGHPLAVRLRAQAARAYARQGRRKDCEDMLRTAQDLHERLPARTPTRFAVDTGTLASYAMTAYPASSYIWLGDAEKGDFKKAKRYAQAAIAVHESAPAADRSPSREAIARLDLGIALAELGAPDEAAAIGRQALASPRVVDSVRSRAGDLAASLAHRYPRLGEAREFHDQYRALASGEEHQ